MTRVSSRIGSRVPTHDSGGVRCRLHHPAPLGRRRGGSVFGFFLAMCSTVPAADAAGGCVLSACSNQNATWLSDNKGVFQ